MTNRAAYEAGLWRPDSVGQRRGDRCLAGAAWWTIPSGQARNSAVAIEVMLIGRLLFHQPRRQTQRLLGSLLEIMGFDLPVLDLPVLVFFRHDYPPAFGFEKPGDCKGWGRLHAERCLCSTYPLFHAFHKARWSAIMLALREKIFDLD